jgi:hypothetical protein
MDSPVTILRRPGGPFRPTSTALQAVRPSGTLHIGRATLLRALARVLGGDQAAETFLRDALEDAGLAKVPEGPEPFVQFVREEILPRLMPLVRLEKLHDLVRRTIGDEDSLHPPPLKPLGSAPGVKQRRSVRARVVVVEPDAMRRVELARALVRAGFDVEVVTTAHEVLRVDAFHAVVVGLDPEGMRVIEELVGRRTRAGLVTYDEAGSRERLRDVIDRWPTDRVAIVARDSTPALLCSRVRIVLE